MPNPVTPELDALVRACFATPKANLPRLVLADYLDEHGDNDRATILRIQCELPPPKKKGNKPKIARGTGKDLREAVARVAERFAPVRPLLGPLKFVRGFLATSDSLWYRMYHDEQYPLLLQLFSEGWCESVRVRSLPHAPHEKLHALLKLVGALEITRGPSPAGALTQLAAECRPGLPGCRLHTLKLPTGDRTRFDQLLGTAKAKPPATPVQDYRNLTPDTAKLVAESGVLDGVRRLTLGGNPGEDGFRQLVEHPAMRAVEHFTAVNLELPAGAWRWLWAVEGERLSSLHLYNVPLGDAGVRGLCANAFRPSEVLGLRMVGMTAGGVRALTACRRLATLTHLNLRENAPDVASVSALVRSRNFAGLRYLDVGESGIAGPELLPALFAAPHRPEYVLSADRLRAELSRPADTLPRLELASATYQHQELTWPTEPPCPEPLAALELNSLRFAPDELAHFRDWLAGRPVPSLLLRNCLRRATDWPHWLRFVAAVRPRELTIRSMESMDLGLRACQQLAASPALATVEKLVIEFCTIRLTGATAIANSPHRGNLKAFVATRCGLGRADLTRLRAALPGVTVTTA